MKNSLSRLVLMATARCAGVMVAKVGVSSIGIDGIAGSSVVNSVIVGKRLSIGISIKKSGWEV